MRIFHNKETNQTIIIADNKAWSFYGYPHDNPVHTARQLLEGKGLHLGISNTCDEIEVPVANDTEASIQKGINMAKKELHKHKTKQKDKSCEHSPNTSKKP